MRSTLYQGKYYATPAGICEAARDGDAKGLELILAERPELLVVDCPHNWSKTVAKHEVRGAHFKKPIEVAAFFNRSSAVSTLLAFSRDSMAFRKPWDDHLPFEGHFNSLRIAIALNHRNITELIEKEIDTRLYLNPGLLNQSDSHGRSTTHWAAEQGYMPLVNRLIERGADWDEPQQSGRRVIHSVLDHKLTEAHRDVARELIERGADCDLWIAVALQDVDRVKELLEQDRSLANQNFRMDLVGLTNGFPLVRACASGNRELVELLLECGADINAELRSCDEKSVNEEPAEFGMPLHAAVYGRHYELANFLLDRGASVLAHPNCASPLVDVLCVATNPESDGMLALGELRYLTDDPTSHLQRTEAGSPEVQKLYERVLAAGAEPQSYSYIIAKDYAAIEQRLREESESSFFNAIAGAACWHGDPRAMELCLTLKPEWYSPEQANKNLAAAIRSHNRNGNHEDYYRVLQLNLDYLKTQDAPTTIQPLQLLATDLLENYCYGTCSALPTTSDMVEFAKLFLQYGVHVNERHHKSGRTALASAVDCGHTEYVKFLLAEGASIDRDVAPDANPVSLARRHGFYEILELLGESRDVFTPLPQPGEISIAPPIPGRAAVRMTPLAHAVIELGVATIEDTFAPDGEFGDTRWQFVEFPNPFDDDEFENVRMLITNRNHPQVVASTTTGTFEGKQGFLIKARNSMPRRLAPEDASASVSNVSFSWMAVLLTEEPQPKRYAVRFGVIPPQDDYSTPHGSHVYRDTAQLFSETPFLQNTGEKHLFLTPTELQAVINASAESVTSQGVGKITGCLTTRHGKDARLNWLAITECNELDQTGEYFDANSLWIHADRAEPRSFSQEHMFGDWACQVRKYPAPFLERKPCVFASSNAQGIDGHHAAVVAMTWSSHRDQYSVNARSFDDVRGQSNFDCITIGHRDDEANSPIKQIETAWDQYVASKGDEGTGYQMAASGRIGVNEFGGEGGSLLMHAAYERFESANLALARRLFALGADANQRHPTSHLTPLHVAVVHNHLQMVYLLMEHGADVNAMTMRGTKSTFPTEEFWCKRTHMGETPLHLAMWHRRWRIAQVLLDAGANQNAEDCVGDRPIDYVPSWASFPDHPTYWQAVNRQSEVTKAVFEELLEILKAEA